MRLPILTVLLFGVAGCLIAAEGQLTRAGGAGVVAWARYYGGTDFEFAERLAVDASGNAYLLARTFSTDLHASVAPVAMSPDERAAATFVLKLGPDGEARYAVTVGTGFGFRAIDVAVGVDGTAFVLGRSGDITHIVKIDGAGGTLVYNVTYDALGPGGMLPNAIAVDAGGQAVITGWAPAGIFVAWLDGRGSVFDMKVLPVSADARDVALDRAGNAYVVGTISSAALPATAGAFQPRHGGGTCGPVVPPLAAPPERAPCPDAFLFKMTRSGGLAYVTYFGGTGWDQGHAVAVDASGAAVIAGLTRSTDLPIARAMQPQCRAGFVPLACGDAFVAKLDPQGASVVFSTFIGGVDAETVTDLAVDAAGAAYVSGTITGSGLTTYRGPQPASGGGTDGFIVALGPVGDLLWSTYLGGAGDERAVGVGTAGGMVHIAGESMSPAWLPARFGGARDLFSARVSDPAR